MEYAHQATNFPSIHPINVFMILSYRLIVELNNFAKMSPSKGDECDCMQLHPCRKHSGNLCWTGWWSPTYCINCVKAFGALLDDYSPSKKWLSKFSKYLKEQSKNKEVSSICSFRNYNPIRFFWRH